jgi:hypothetical protein
MLNPACCGQRLHRVQPSCSSCSAPSRRLLELRRGRRRASLAGEVGLLLRQRVRLHVVASSRVSGHSRRARPLGRTPPRRSCVRGRGRIEQVDGCRGSISLESVTAARPVGRGGLIQPAPPALRPRPGVTPQLRTEAPTRGLTASADPSTEPGELHGEHPTSHYRTCGMAHPRPTM